MIIYVENLVIKRKGYEAYIWEWITSPEIYRRRAAFTLIASSAMHDKGLSNETLDLYLKLIREYSDQEHDHIKKAASWALREIGKRDFEANEKALLLACEMKETGNKTQVWIAKDAIKELENVVKAEGRRRLISASTKMGKSKSE